MPRGKRKPTPLPTVAQLYLGALDLALDPAVSPEGRERAGRFMRDVADEARGDRGPGETSLRGRVHTYDHDMQAAVRLALDHRICGES